MFIMMLPLASVSTPGKMAASIMASLQGCHVVRAGDCEPRSSRLPVEDTPPTAASAGWLATRSKRLIPTKVYLLVAPPRMRPVVSFLDTPPVTQFVSVSSSPLTSMLADVPVQKNSSNSSVVSQVEPCPLSGRS